MAGLVRLLPPSGERLGAAAQWVALVQRCNRCWGCCSERSGWSVVIVIMSLILIFILIVIAIAIAIASVINFMIFSVQGYPFFK
jgi:hypothetical protein